jgi:hypothetical protein
MANTLYHKMNDIMILCRIVTLNTSQSHTFFGSSRCYPSLQKNGAGRLDKAKAI